MYATATSVAPRGKIEIAKRANKPIPEGWVIDQLRGEFSHGSCQYDQRNGSGECGFVTRPTLELTLSYKEELHGANPYAG